jgi:hypothetical protein
VAQQPACDLDATNKLRQLAVEHARTGALISPDEMALIFHYRPSRFYQLNREGAFNAFKVIPAIGARCFSGTLVTRYLAGDPVFASVMSRRTSAGSRR